MRQGFFKDYPPFAQLVFALLIWIILALIFTGISFAFAVLIFDVDYVNLKYALNDLSNPDNIALLKFLQIFSSIGAFVIPPFVIAYFINLKPISFLSLNSNTQVTEIFLVILIMFALVPIINFLTIANAKILELPDFMVNIERWIISREELAQAQTKVLLKADNYKVFLLNLFMIAIIPAVGEELLFRGVIQKLCIKWTNNIFWGIFIASFLFSFLHFQFLGFIPRMLLGFVLGYFYVLSKNIWLPIIGHFINNGAAVFVYYKYGDKFVTENIDSIGTSKESFIYLVISVAVVVFLFYFLRKQLDVKKLSD